MRTPSGARGVGRRAHREQSGAALIESLVASTLLGVAMVGLIATYSTFAVGARNAQLVAEAEGLARSDASVIKAAAYQANGAYGSFLPTGGAVPTGITRLTPVVVWWDGTSAWTSTQNAQGLQKITLSYTGAGRTLLTLELVKANR